jgi:hypothetical protein
LPLGSGCGVIPDDFCVDGKQRFRKIGHPISQ